MDDFLWLRGYPVAEELYVSAKINDYEGQAICPGGLQIASRMKCFFKGLKASTNVTQLKSFLGWGIVFRRLVPSLASIASLLNNRLRVVNR